MARLLASALWVGRVLFLAVWIGGPVSAVLERAAGRVYAEAVGLFLGGLAAVWLAATVDAALRNSMPSYWLPRSAWYLAAGILASLPALLIVLLGPGTWAADPIFPLFLSASFVRFLLEAWSDREAVLKDLFDPFLSLYMYFILLFLAVAAVLGLGLAFQPLPAHYLRPFTAATIPAVIVTLAAKVVIALGALAGIAFMLLLATARLVPQSDLLVRWAFRKLGGRWWEKGQGVLFILVLLVLLPWTMITGLELVSGLTRRVLALIGGMDRFIVRDAPPGDELNGALRAFFEAVDRINRSPLTLSKLVVGAKPPAEP